MKGSKVAVRYARSLFALAQNDSELEKIKMDVDLIDQICKDRSFRAMLNSPVINEKKKISIFNELFDGAVSKPSKLFLNMLAENHRESELPEILSSFNDLYLAHRGKIKVYVTSAVALDEKSRNKIADLVKQHTNNEVLLEESTDNSLIGGFKLRFSDIQIDTSLESKLRNVQKELLKKVN